VLLAPIATMFNVIASTGVAIARAAAIAKAPSLFTGSPSA
jgi:hypothetical protein